MAWLWRAAPSAAPLAKPGRPDAPSGTLSGTSFLQLEPDLVKEAGLSGRVTGTGAFLPE